MSLVKNSSWNLIGTAASAVVMVPAMAFFARRLDTEAFGLITLVLAFVGYASVLDGGFARAVVREIALAGKNKEQSLSALGSATWIVLALGVGFGVALWLLTPFLVEFLEVSAGLYFEAIAGFHWMGVIVLPLLLGMLWMAPLEGYGLFAQLNMVRSLGYSMVFGAAMLAVWVDPTFVSGVIGLLVGRFLMAALAYASCIRVMGRSIFYFSAQSVKHLCRFSGWLTVSNLISPLMDYLDRFVLSSFSGASSVAYYSAPADAIAKLLTLPGSVARAAFPTLSSLQGKQVAKVVANATLLQLCLGVLVVGFIQLFGESLMGFWLGSEYAEKSGLLIRILVFGFLFNAVSMIPQMALQGMGASKTTAFAHMVEFAPFLSLLYFMTAQFQLVGTACAWVVRTFVDMCLMYYLYHRERINRDRLTVNVSVQKRSDDAKQTKTAIIIVNWNGWEDTARCLAACARLDGFTGSVFVVDNGSTNDSFEKLRQWLALKVEVAVNPEFSHLESRGNHRFDHVVVGDEEAVKKDIDHLGIRERSIYVVKSTSNFGFGAGNNIGIRLAMLSHEVDLFWCLNSDALPQPDALSALEAQCKNCSAPLVAGSVLLDYAVLPTIQTVGSDFSRWNLKVAYKFSGKPVSFLQTLPDVYPVDYPVGASLLINRAYVDRYGMFDERYFLYFEEPDLVQRLEGGSAFICTKSLVYHKGGQSTGGGSTVLDRSPLADYHYNKSRAILAYKMGVAALVMACVASAYSVARRLRKGRPDLAKNVLSALRDGFKSAR